MKINARQLEAVISLPGSKRYATFIKVAADQRCVWGLYGDGWALAKTDEGEQAFPLWPAREYAETCISGAWGGYSPRDIDLDTLLGRLLPKLGKTGTLVAIFPTPKDKGVTPDLKVLRGDLLTELRRLE
jgi:hypothetical protein